ncbi:hypothetical protein GCM10027030_05160 [Luteococcus sediminum]
MSTDHISRTLLTVDEAAALLRRTPGTLRWWRHAGQGPRSFTLGRRVYYDRADLMAWIEAEAQRTARGGGAV